MKLFEKREQGTRFRSTRSWVVTMAALIEILLGAVGQTPVAHPPDVGARADERIDLEEG
jgi:hypothetical protein